VLLSDAQQIGRWVAVGKLFNEAKAKGHAADKNWTTEVFPALCPDDKPFGIGKAEKLMGIADEPSSATILPIGRFSRPTSARSTLSGTSTSTLGQARWHAGSLGSLVVDDEKVTMHPDLEVKKIDEIGAKLAPPADVDPAAARAAVAKQLGVKPNDPMVDKVLAETGVAKPAPPAKPSRKSRRNRPASCGSRTAPR